MEISSMQHSFVRAVNDSNIHAIMMNTGAKIIFPDLSDANIQQIKRSRISITGEINCVYNARQQLLVRFLKKSHFKWRCTKLYRKMLFFVRDVFR
jgi:hypothetical protein